MLKLWGDGTGKKKKIKVQGKNNEKGEKEKIITITGQSASCVKYKKNRYKSIIRSQQAITVI